MARLYEGVQADVASLYEREADVVVAHGPFRSGKTSAALDGFVMYALVNGGTYLLAAPTLAQVENTLVRQILDNHPLALRRGRPGGELFVGGPAEQGGTTFLCRSGSDSAAEGHIRGLTLQGAFLDEVTLLDEGYYQQVSARCSEGRGGKIVCCTNPDAPSHWLKEKVIDRADGARIEAYQFSIDDNPSLSPEFKARQRRTLTGIWLQRGYYGEWVAAAGAVYPTLADCTGRPVDGAEPVAVWLAGDWGNTDPTHFVRIEEHEDGVRYVVREWRWSHDDGGHLTDAEKAKALLRHLGGGAITAIHVDPSALAMIAELRRRTSVPVQGAENAVLDGIQQTSSMLELGRLRIDESACPETYAEMARYAWNTKAIARGATVPEHEHSHAPDAIRYHVASSLRADYWDEAL